MDRRFVLIPDEDYNILGEHQTREFINLENEQFNGLTELEEVLNGRDFDLSIAARIWAFVEALPEFQALRGRVYGLIAAGPGAEEWWEFSPPQWEGMTWPKDREPTEQELADWTRFTEDQREVAEHLAEEYRSKLVEAGV